MATETGGNPEAERERRKARIRLHDMVVESVDLVDRPANLKRFLIVKREDEMDNENGGSSDLETRPAGTPSGDSDVTVGVADPESGATGAADAGAATGAEGAATGEGAGADAGAAAKKPVAKDADADAAKQDDEEEEEDKDKDKEGEGAGETAKAIPTPVRDAVVKTLGEAGERLMSVNNALRSATVTQDRVSAPLPDAVFRELKAVQTLVKSILQRYPFPSAAGQAEKMEGDPVDVGLETSVELMKQAGDMKIPAPVRDAVSKAIREASEMLLSIMNAVKGMSTTDEESATPLPAETAKAIGGVLGALDTVLEKYPAPAAKSDAAMAVLEKAFDSIRDVVKGFAAGEIIVKSEGASGSADVEAVTKSVQANADAVKKLTAEVAKLSGKPGASNALEDDGTAEPTAKGAGRTAWPQDIAEDIRKRDAEAAQKGK